MRMDRRICILLAVIGFLFQPAAAGEEMEGEITALDLGRKVVAVGYWDFISETDKVTEVMYDERTLFSGVRSADDLVLGDSVIVTAQREEGMPYALAESIEVGRLSLESSGDDEDSW